MSKMEYLVIHCTDTPYNREVTPTDIHFWHKGMKNNGDGTVVYLGKKMKFEEIENLKLKMPSGNLITVKSTNGRGWSQVGYSDLITRSGELINLVPYNNDDVIDSAEITNGAVGYNSKSRHVVLAGGWDKTGKLKSGVDSTGKRFKPEDLFTPEQLKTLKLYIKKQIGYVKTLKIVGHNDVASKPCPNFDVKEFMKNLDKY